jgi:hypothetical protein
MFLLLVAAVVVMVIMVLAVEALVDIELEALFQYQ